MFDFRDLFLPGSEGCRNLRHAQSAAHLAQPLHGVRLSRPHLEPGCPGFAQTLVHHPPADLTLQQLNALLLHLLRDERLLLGGGSSQLDKLHLKRSFLVFLSKS